MVSIGQIQEEVSEAIQSALSDAQSQKLSRARYVQLVLSRVHAVFARHQDEAPLPDVVGVTAAAEILGVNKPRIYKLDAQGRMPKPALSPDNGPLYRRSEVERLRDELVVERAERERKRAEAAAAA